MARIAAGPTGEERREQILDAAMTVFARRGYAEATNKDIATVAGVTAPLIYHYFRTKRDVLHALLVERGPMAALTRVLDADDSAGHSPREWLTSFALELLERAESTHNSPVFQMMVGEALRDDEVRSLFSQLLQQTEDAVAVHITRYINEGTLRRMDAHLVARLFVGALLHSSMCSTKLGGLCLREYTHEHLASTLVDIVLNGMEERTNELFEASPDCGFSRHSDDCRVRSAVPNFTDDRREISPIDPDPSGTM